MFEAFLAKIWIKVMVLEIIMPPGTEGAEVSILIEAPEKFFRGVQKQLDADKEIGKTYPYWLRKEWRRNLGQNTSTTGAGGG